MRYLLVLPLFVLFLVGCAKSDREMLNGTWSFHELKGRDGKVMFSTDKAKQKELTDEMVKDQLAMYAGAGIDEKTLRDMATKQFAAMEKMTFTFDEKGVAKVETNDKENKERDTESKFTMDDKKKEIVIKSEDREMKYTYKFDGDKVTMKGESEEFTLVKKN